MEKVDFFNGNESVKTFKMIKRGNQPRLSKLEHVCVIFEPNVSQLTRWVPAYIRGGQSSWPKVNALRHLSLPHHLCLPPSHMRWPILKDIFDCRFNTLFVIRMRWTWPLFCDAKPKNKTSNALYMYMPRRNGYQTVRKQTVRKQGKIKKEETKSINVLDHDHTIEEETDFKRSESKKKLKKGRNKIDQCPGSWSLIIS